MALLSSSLAPRLSKSMDNENSLAGQKARAGGRPKHRSPLLPLLLTPLPSFCPAFSLHFITVTSAVRPHRDLTLTHTQKRLAPLFMGPLTRLRGSVSWRTSQRGEAAASLDGEGDCGILGAGGFPPRPRSGAQVGMGSQTHCGGLVGPLQRDN